MTGVDQFVERARRYWDTTATLSPLYVAVPCFRCWLDELVPHREHEFHLSTRFGDDIGLWSVDFRSAVDGSWRPLERVTGVGWMGEVFPGSDGEVSFVAGSGAPDRWCVWGHPKWAMSFGVYRVRCSAEPAT